MQSGPEVTFRKYLVLAGVTVFSTAGDSLLARGMKELGGISLHNFSSLILAILNPSVASESCCFWRFFSCYMSALSWADLTYVLPASSLGYVLVALIAHFSFTKSSHPLAGSVSDDRSRRGLCRRWPLSHYKHTTTRVPESSCDQLFLRRCNLERDFTPGSAIGRHHSCVNHRGCPSLLLHETVGDVGELLKKRGILAVIARVLATPTFSIGLVAMGCRVL